MFNKVLNNKFIVPILLIFLFTGLNHYLLQVTTPIDLPFEVDIITIVSHITRILLYCSIFIFVIRLTDVVIFKYFIEKKLLIKIPKLFIDVYNTLVFIGLIVAILNQIFNVPLVALFATISAIGVVVGFALKDILADIFSGIALNSEKSFKIGDNVELDNGIVGIVRDITWRATYIEEPTRMMTIVPNAKMNNMQIRNYHFGEKYYQLRLSFHLKHDIPTERVLRIVNSALKDENMNINSEMSDVHVIDIDELGVKYGLRFFVPDISSEYPIRSKLLCSIMDNLYRSGLTPSYPNRDVFFTEMPARILSSEARKEFVVSRLELFETLSSSEKEILIGILKERRYSIGDAIVKQGEEGSSLFILVEGLLGVSIRDEETNKDIKVGKLQAGNTFGEFSLLTGENRSATVTVEHDCIVYEIKKEDFSIIIENNPELANYLAQILAKRQLSTKQEIENTHSKEQKIEIEKVNENILAKIAKMFNL